MLEYCLFISVIISCQSLHFQHPLPALVDPVLCQVLNRQTTWTDMDLQLLDLCNENYTTKTRRRRENEKTKMSVKSRLTLNQQKLMVDLHNKFRSQVHPPAADMNFMTWDNILAASAQLWADKCEFVHGRPEGYDDIGMGQNLYVGPDSTGERAVSLWYEENEFYDFEEDVCLPDEQCGHYVQLVWAVSKFVGCAVTKCRALGFLFVCHYSPQGNHPDAWPYFVGPPCSQCRNHVDGGLCYNKTCVTGKECVEYNLTCDCYLECQNCAKLNAKNCRCNCKTGWDSLDCSKPCNDLHEHCGQDPGWPNVMSCGQENNKVRDQFCRKMCRQCSPAVDDSSSETDQDTCCKGEMCDDGMVLNITDCQCQALCPGPVCYPPKPTKPTLGTTTSDGENTPCAGKICYQSNTTQESVETTDDSSAERLNLSILLIFSVFISL